MNENEKERIKLFQLNERIGGLQGTLDSTQLFLRNKVVQYDRAYSGNDNWRDKESIEREIKSLGREIDINRDELQKLETERDILSQKIETIEILEEQDKINSEQNEELKNSEQSSIGFLDINE